MNRRSSLKSSYLFRIVCSLSAVFVLVASFFAAYVVYSTYRNLRISSENTSKELNEAFYLYYDDLLTSCRDYAIKIGQTNYFDPQNSEYRINRKMIEQNPYYAYRTMEVLKKYHNGISNVEGIGVYFDGGDYVITDSYKYSMEDYLGIMAGGEDKSRWALRSFFEGKHAESIRTVSTFAQQSVGQGRLLIGIPVRFDTVNSGLIFYVINKDSLKTRLINDPKNAVTQFFIYDSEGSLFFANQELPGTAAENAAAVQKAVLESENSFLFSLNGREFRFFNKKYETLPYTFLVAVEQSQVERNAGIFFKTYIFGFLIVLALFVTLLAITGYIAYHPVRRIVKKINGALPFSGSRSGEIDTILQAFDRMEWTVTEQKEMVREYVILNLIHHAAVPDNAEKLFPELFSCSARCVLVSPLIPLSSPQRKKLETAADTGQKNRIYVADMLTQETTVFLCLLQPGDTPRQTAALLSDTLSGFGFADQPLGYGEPTTEIDEVYLSYQQAVALLQQQTTGNAGRKYDQIQKGLNETIGTLMHCIAQREEASSVALLEEIRSSANANHVSQAHQRYIQYKLLIEYLACVKQDISQKETERLMSCNSLKDFCFVLESSIHSFCENNPKESRTACSKLKEDILRYVDDHITDPEICRTQIADQFGISIYSFSRLFKEATGTGYKEYLTAKKMELARQKILTTDRNLNQIGEDVGFLNAEHFSKMFKSYFGVAPSYYRQQGRLEQQENNCS